MKKVLFTLVLACFAVVSCQKTIGTSQKEAESKGFTATINTMNKTTLNPTSGQVSWNENDIININGSSFRTNKSGSTAIFTTDDAYFVETGSYEAFFPSSIASKSLPSSYNYTKENSNYLPMYAYSTTKALSFNNICSVIALTIPATMNVNKVELSTTDNKALNGNFTISSNKAVMTKTTGLTSSDKILSITGSALTGVVYIPVPAGTYSSFTIEIFDTSGSSVSRTKSNFSFPVSCIQPITFSMYVSSFELSETPISNINDIL